MFFSIIFQLRGFNNSQHMAADRRSNLSKKLKIINDLGLHARAAAKIAKIAQHANKKVWLSKDDQRVDASSIIDILTLACPPGSFITLTLEDPSDSKILDEIEILFNNRFGE